MVGDSREMDADFLRALPEYQPAERGEEIQAVGDGEKVVPFQLAVLAGEPRLAVREKNFGFADPGGIQQQLAGSWFAGGILGRDVELQVAQRHPGRFAAPPGLDQLVLEGKQGAEGGAGPWRLFLLEVCPEAKRAGPDDNLRVRSFHIRC